MPDKRNRPRKIEREDERVLTQLGQRLEYIIINELGYESVDQFAIDHHGELSIKTIAEIRRGKRNPTLKSLRKIAKFTNKTVAELLEGIC